MKTLHGLVLGLGMALAINAPADTNTIKAPVLKGTVVDAAGRPVEGAVVERYEYGPTRQLTATEMELKQRVIAGTNGGFEVEISRAITVLVARKTGLAPAWRQFARDPGEEQRLVLNRPAVLAGVVVDEKDKPVADAEVSVAVAIIETERDGGGRGFDYLMGKSARDAFRTRTGADGRFRIDGFPTNASADLVVQAPGKTLRLAPREYLGPDTMQCRGGQEDIRLVVEPASVIEGRIVAEGDGPPLPPARLTLRREGGDFGQGVREATEAGADGAFRMADVPGGSYRIFASFGTNQPADWVAEAVPVSVESGQTNREVKLTATRGGVLEAVVVGKGNREPQAEARVNAYKEGVGGAATTGSNGVALLRVLPGEYRISVGKEGARAENTSVSVEGGKTNRIEIELTPSPKIAGVVRRPDGQPAAGLAVRIVGVYSDGGTGAKTDPAGKFELAFDPRQFGGADRTPCLLIRDPERNLAVAADVEEDAGPLDLRLAPGITLVGRAECDGKPLTNAGAALVFWTGNSGMHLYGMTSGTNTPGRFEITALPPGRRYGVYVSAPGYGQKYVNVGESEAAGERVELEPVELKPANLKVAGQVVDADDKPVAGASVNVSGEGQPNANVRTDRDGRFRFEKVCEGSVRLYGNARGTSGSITAEGGDTNVVLKLGESVNTYAGATNRKLNGMVTAPDGRPAAGAQVSVFPSDSSRRVKTGADGSYNLTWSIQPWQLQSGGDPCLVVRDAARNLAASADLAEGTTNLDLRLEPALTLVGRVEGPDGKALANAQVGVWLLACRTYSQVSEQLATTDARGGFEIKTLPLGRQYIVYAKAKGHGRSQTNVEPEAETNRVELPPFVLKMADQILSGQVLDPNEKPVSGVNISLSGEGQPEGSATTDSKGRFSFKVCEGQVRLFASGGVGYANATAEAGDTNVVIQLSRSDSSSRESPRRASLKGKPVPDLTALGLASGAVPAGRPLLLCLFDYEQRPSRRSVRLLAERHDTLRERGLAVVGVQAAVTSAESLQAWKEANPLPFPVGRVADKSVKTRWASGVELLPWLILTDAGGRVVAEGFVLDELDTQLKALGK